MAPHASAAPDRRASSLGARRRRAAVARPSCAGPAAGAPPAHVGPSGGRAGRRCYPRRSEEAIPLHLIVKACALALVALSLTAAFRAERSEPVDLAIAPRADVLATPRAGLAATDEPHGPIATPTFTVRATGYNSLASQTDGTPHVTATGTRTRFGVLAVSRDLLAGDLPYGSLVRLRDKGTYYDGRGAGRYQGLLDGHGLFVVEDTMHARKRQQIDVWFGDYASAVNWGVRELEVRVVRYGYDGPLLDRLADAPFEGRPILTASAR
jgi:3D (Asp-Asp-Asp) domain-containing protein